MVVPVFNEEACIATTIDELFLVLNACGQEFEVIAVDDGSVDRTPGILHELRLRHPRLRVCTLEHNCGQSAAFGAGFARARGGVVVTMDADGQNDPRDILPMLERLKHCDACCGIRQVRRDSWRKRVGSRLANAVRRRLLHDGTVDTGCSLKAIRSELARDLPMSIKGMHRFIPALLQMRGARIEQIGVNHRARSAGESKYTNLGRLPEALRDLRMVRWMQKRHCQVSITEERSSG